MPTYEYHCPACNATYDLRQSYSAETTHICEECGKGTAKRVLHAPPVVFKGSGWYVTDSRGKSSSPSNDRHASDHGSSDSDSDSSPAPASTETKDSSSSTKSGGESSAAAAS